MQATVKYRSTSVTVTITGGDRPVIGTVYKDCTLGRQFEAIVDEKHRAAIVAACKQSFKEIEDVKIDLEAGEVVEAGFVARESAQPVKTYKQVKGQQFVRKSKAQEWDDMYNEGGEGYNPYRN